MIDFQSDVWDAHDVCSNCFGIRRHEAVRPRRRHPDVTYWERDRQRTEVGYAPTRSMSDSRNVHCECGTLSAFDRIWGVDDLDTDAFCELIQRLILTLEERGHEVDRLDFAYVALAGWYRIPRHEDGEEGPRRRSPVDAALSDAVSEAVECGANGPEQCARA